MIGKKRIILLATILSICFAMGCRKIVFAEGSLIVGGETLSASETENKNADGTATYDYENDTLILNDYGGGPIFYNEDTALTIVLNGSNAINATNENYGIYAEDADVKLTGSGDLSIVHTERSGISIKKGSLIIDNTSIGIADSDNDGIYVGDDFTMAGGKLIIKNAAQGISADNFVVEDGEINIDVDIMSILTSLDIKINGGKLTLKSHIVGIIAQRHVEINGGYVDIDAGEEGLSAAIVIPKFSEDIYLKIADNMKIAPEDVSVQSADLNYDGDEFESLTIGKPGATILLDGLDAASTNTASKVTIYTEEEQEEENPPTGENIVPSIIIGGGSLIILAGYIIYTAYVNRKREIYY